MSDPKSPLMGVSYAGYAQITEIGPLGMITLRAKDGVEGLEKTIKAVVGCAKPQQREIKQKGESIVAWMSPDEYLLMVPYNRVGAALEKIEKGLLGQHYLAADVSDARAVFRIEGEKADQVLRKLAPVDFDALGVGEIRRSRVAQVAAAFWRNEKGFTLVCFRSVAGYVMGLLRHSAQPESELF